MMTIPIGTEFLAVESAMVKYVKSISDNKNVADISAGFTKTFKFFSNGAWLSAACRPAFIKALVAVCDGTAEMTDYSPLCKVLAGEDKLIMRVGGIVKAREIVASAPDGAIGFGGEDGDCDYYRGNEYFDSDYGLWVDVYFEMPLINKIDDLRAAIAEHDRHNNSEVSK